MDVEALHRLERIFNTVETSTIKIAGKKQKLGDQSTGPVVEKNISTTEAELKGTNETTNSSLDISAHSSGNGTSSTKLPFANSSDAIEPGVGITSILVDPVSIAWTRYYDTTSSRFYYYNSMTKVTQWEKPEGYIDTQLPSASLVPSATVTPSSTSYSTIASFSTSNGAFAQSGHGTYWDSVNRPGDREGRQMSAFFDLNALDRNRQEARERQEQLRRSGIDWKAYKEEKKAEKRKRRNQWLLEE